MVGGWFIDGSTARLLSFSRMVVYVLRLCLCVVVVSFFLDGTCANSISNIPRILRDPFIVSTGANIGV